MIYILKSQLAFCNWYVRDNVWLFHYWQVFQLDYKLTVFTSRSIKPFETYTSISMATNIVMTDWVLRTIVIFTFILRTDQRYRQEKPQRTKKIFLDIHAVNDQDKNRVDVCYLSPGLFMKTIYKLVRCACGLAEELRDLPLILYMWIHCPSSSLMDTDVY